MIPARAAYVALLLPLGLFLCGCQWLGPGAPRGGSDIPASESAHGLPSLTAVVADLQMHLRDDTYRFDRARRADGRNVFAVSLWRLDRLRRERSRSEAGWENPDVVIAFARARALERLRRYDEAGREYDRVAAHGSLLEDPAIAAGTVMRRFVAHAGPPAQPLRAAEDERDWIELRLEKWRGLALEYRETIYEPLAREELEAWEMLRVEWFARHGDPAEAISAVERMIEGHAHSKLYPKHLIRLGDLYAQAARELHVRFRATAVAFDGARYERMVDKAFASYELASQQHKTAFQREAEGKIGALLSYHQTVKIDAP